MKRKKEAPEVKLDISETFQPVAAGYYKSSLKELEKAKNKSVDAILANGVLETREGVDRIKILRMIHRVLKPGGKVAMNVAYWGSAAASMSPFSKWPPLSPESFGFFCADVRKRSNYDNPALADIDFDLHWSELYPAEWQSKNDTTRAFAAKHYTNVLSGLAVTLTKKGGK